MDLATLVDELDLEYRVAAVRGDDWADIFAEVYPDPYWREYAEPGYEGRWNGLMLRGANEVAGAATCVFPSDAVIAAVDQGTFLFSEHPVDFADEPGFLPLAQESLRLMRERGISLYNVHAPLDMHPRFSPSRLMAEGTGMTIVDEFFPIAEGLAGGAAIIAEGDVTTEELAERLRRVLGNEVPVQVVASARVRLRRIAFVGGGGADPAILAEALERRADAYVTGNAITRSLLDFVQQTVADFRARAEAAGITVLDGTHYGTEKPPQEAMVGWFEQRGVPCRFVPDGPK
jgi:putative NIF3 family GTP cyclohydrolase 1 type 2